MNHRRNRTSQDDWV